MLRREPSPELARSLQSGQGALGQCSLPVAARLRPPLRVLWLPVRPPPLPPPGQTTGTTWPVCPAQCARPTGRFVKGSSRRAPTAPLGSGRMGPVSRSSLAASSILSPFPRCRLCLSLVCMLQACTMFLVLCDPPPALRLACFGCALLAAWRPASHAFLFACPLLCSSAF